MITSNAIVRSSSPVPSRSTERARISLGRLVVDCRSLTAAVLSGIALFGRIVMVLTAGPASVVQLCGVLLIGAGACALGTHAAACSELRSFSRLLARVGQRAGAIQVALSVVSLALLIW